MSNMFEVAVRTKLRFSSPKGDLSAEQLWDVPLRSRDDFNLNTVAVTANKALKALSEESFVDNTKSPGQTRLELAMDIVQYVISVRKDEEAAAKQRADNKIEREKLLKILAEKQEGKLSEMSEKDLQKRIAALE